MPKLTKTLVERAEVKNKPYFLFDDQLAGFCVRILSTGKRHYYVQYLKPQLLPAKAGRLDNACKAD